jgi:hypothetical protein
MTDVKDRPDGQWQHLWFLLQTVAWSALALVPADKGMDVRAVANTLVDIARQNGVANITMLDAVGARFNDMQDVLLALEGSKKRGAQVVVSCDHPDDNPAVLTIARAASRTLLVVGLGQSRIEAARKTVEAVGRERVMASITLGPKYSRPLNGGGAT